jgi:hypothetical protein
MIVLWRQAHVFVQIERPATREVETFLFMHVRQQGINPFHGPAGGQAEYKARVLPQGPGNQARDQPRGHVNIRLDNDFHGKFLNALE